MRNAPDEFDGDNAYDAIMDIKEKVDKMYTAFPSGDIDGHRRYHETQIEKIAEIRRLRIAIQEKTISGLIWAAIIWLGSIILHNMQDYFRGVIH